MSSIPPAVYAEKWIKMLEEIIEQIKKEIFYKSKRGVGGVNTRKARVLREYFDTGAKYIELLGKVGTSTLSEDAEKEKAYRERMRKIFEEWRAIESGKPLEK